MERSDSQAQSKPEGRGNYSKASELSLDVDSFMSRMNERLSKFRHETSPEAADVRPMVAHENVRS